MGDRGVRLEKDGRLEAVRRDRLCIRTSFPKGASLTAQRARKWTHPVASPKGRLFLLLSLDDSPRRFRHDES